MVKFILFDILKNKVVILYTVLLFGVSWAVLGMESNYTKVTLSLLNLVGSAESSMDSMCVLQEACRHHKCQVRHHKK